MSGTPKRRRFIFFVQGFCLVATACIAFEVCSLAVRLSDRGLPWQGQENDAPVLKQAYAVVPWMNGLAVVFPTALLAAALCATIGIFRKTRQKRIRALWLALALFVVCVASLVGNRVLLAYVLLPNLGRAYFELAQSGGTLTSVGEAAPAFTVITSDGEAVGGADLRGKVVLLNFFAGWCGPCIQELPEMQQIWDRFHADDRFRMLVIGREETIDSVRAFSEEHHFTFPMAADPERSAFDRFATDGIPRTYLISRDGKIIFQCLGNYEDQIASLPRLLKAELAKQQ
jgi:peroxiredoxin